jgi:hypothetical protein
MFFNYKFILRFLKMFFCGLVFVTCKRGLLWSVCNYEKFIYAIFARRIMFVLARNAVRTYLLRCLLRGHTLRTVTRHRAAGGGDGGNSGNTDCSDKQGVAL